MRFYASVFTACSLLFVAPANATEPETDDTSKAEKVEKAEPKKICRRIATDMNSRRTSRVCKTKEQWREFNRGQ